METKRISEQLRESAREAFYASDANDLVKLADLVDAGSWPAAWKHYEQMDTYARDSVRDDIAIFIETKAAGTKFVIPIDVVVKGSDKVYQEGWAPGVVAKVTMELPGSRDDGQIVMTMAHQRLEILNSLFEVRYGKPQKEQA